jgi:adenylate cyclase
VADIFISYARSTEAQARRIADELRAVGYDVWSDSELPAHRSYGDVIEEQLSTAKAILVVWSADAVRSQWVRAEADVARNASKLVQLTIDDAALPLPFNQLHCANFKRWSGDLQAQEWSSVLNGIAALTESAVPACDDSASVDKPSSDALPRDRRTSICVLPFANMSRDPEQEYFSDGISEDIITDLSKVAALAVVARNTAFTFKGRAVDARKAAQEMAVDHILEGSVRKSANRVRITAQLIDGASGSHVWAERYDRDLTDIFAIQDEISQAIVDALKLRLLPAEKQAIERRGTTSVEAYNHFLMARQHYVATSEADSRRNESIIRLCRRAVEIDPGYADAWALLALAQTLLFFAGAKTNSDGLEAAERALSLNPDLAEPHAVKARHLAQRGLATEAFSEIDLALRLAPESFEVNSAAGALNYRERRLNGAIRHYEAAMALMADDMGSPGMLVSCYTATGDTAAMRRVAEIALSRAEQCLASDPGNTKAMSFGINALAALGDKDKAREWIDRALLIDPDNLSVRFNCACALCSRLGDKDAAIELLGPFFAEASRSLVDHALADSDLDPIGDDLRFQAMVREARERIAVSAAL